MTLLLRRQLLSLIAAHPLAWAAAPEPAAPSAPAVPADDAARLAALVNQHRLRHGLPAVPRSATLNAVAEAHVHDLQRHPPRAPCNLHSWSDQGRWTPCCYTANHAEARCMWRKPAELSAGRFRAEGFELVAWTSVPITPEAALAAWRGSDTHEAMILNRGIWQHSTWAAMGVALAGQHAVLWFSHGREAD